MKKEIKTIYRSYDGRIFDSENECKDYEKTLDYLVLDEYCESIKIEEIDNFGFAQYIYCKNAEGAEKIYSLLHEYYTLPWNEEEECYSGFWVRRGSEWIEVFVPDVIIDLIKGS